MSAEVKTNQTENREMVRKMLIQLQHEAQERIKTLRRDQAQESESEPTDEMDSARATAEVETHAGLIARGEEKLRYLDEALARLDAGKYGQCLKCGDEIPIERLRVIPFASYCVDCQRNRKQGTGGWGEGTAVEPYGRQWNPPEEMKEPVERESPSIDFEERLTLRNRGPIGIRRV